MKYDRDFYARNKKFQTALFDAIGKFIADEFKPASIIDFGCGCGAFSGRIAGLCGADVIGINGDRPENREIEIFIKNLERSLDFKRQFDLVVSLEVAEHLPLESADGFIDMLCRHGNRILFSAATPGQGGVGHVNEQPHEYWHKKFLDRGYKCRDIIRPILKGKKSVPFWYRENIFVYEAARD